MPLLSPAAPPAAVHAVRTALTSPTAIRQARSLRAAQGACTLLHSHPVHVLTPSSPARRAPATMHPAGWRFLIGGADETPIASAEAVSVAGGWTVSHFSEGPFVTSTYRALLQAEKLPGHYEPRVLSVPGLYMLALWLHGDTASDTTGDVLIPLAPAPPGIAAHRFHHAGDLLPALTERLASTPLLAGSA